MPPADAPAGPPSELVLRVKAAQRQSEDSKQRWWAWCDAHGGGVRDPQRHSAEFLEEFVDGLGLRKGTKRNAGQLGGGAAQRPGRKRRRRGAPKAAPAKDATAEAATAEANAPPGGSSGGGEDDAALPAKPSGAPDDEQGPSAGHEGGSGDREGGDAEVAVADDVDLGAVDWGA
mmetsp:Transcript_125918/g.356111  ORF Transcript_125918/g.356111 Transcript_125918/m.356111 type:complete len:174 (+) Transcript_125918:11-532(+)